MSGIQSVLKQANKSKKDKKDEQKEEPPKAAKNIYKSVVDRAVKDYKSGKE